jgi:regulator of protease activity HflC (stomatin/prohibitin superfamily)
MPVFEIWLAGLALVGVGVIAKSVKIIGQAEVMVIERLGRFHRVARSGLNLLIPFVERPRMLNVRYFESDVGGV